MKHNIAKRRDQVYDLCILKHQNPQDVADVMELPIRTIKADIAELNKKMAAEIMEIGYENLLANIIKAHDLQRERIFSYMESEIPDTARAKYESILGENLKQSERYYEKLVKVAHKMGGSELEDTLASMSFTKFNEYLGFPIHPVDHLPRSITQAQTKIFEAIHPTKRSWICLNKSRQCGFTEIVLRCMVYYAFSKYKGKKIAIVAGTRVETTLEIFDRLKSLFRNISETVKLSSTDRFELKNGTSFHVVPASKNAINGWSGFAAFLLDESGFWNLEEDIVILNSFLPIARTNRSDVYMISNPNGPRGFFYHICQSESPAWTRFELNIHEGGRELYTKEQIEEMITSSEEDPASSYLCKFVGGRDSIFGDLSEEDISKINKEVIFD